MLDGWSVCWPPHWWLWCSTASRGPSCPRSGPAGHRRDLDAFHVGMGTAMIAMLVAPPSRALSVADRRGRLPLGSAGAWSGCFVGADAAYLRLAVGCGAMVGMVLLPATAATAAGTAHAAGAHGHGGAVTGPALVVPLLLVALMVVVAGRMLDAARSRVDGARPAGCVLRRRHGRRDGLHARPHALSHSLVCVTV